MGFAERLKELRESHIPKIYQKELADAVGVSRQAITMWETGQRIPESETLQNLADFFNCSIDYLMGRTNTRETPEQRIESAILDDPELLEFWQELKLRDDLQLLFKQVKPLPPEAIKRIIKYIKMVEDEESKED